MRRILVHALVLGDHSLMKLAMSRTSCEQTSCEKLRPFSKEWPVMARPWDSTLGSIIETSQWASAQTTPRKVLRNLNVTGQSQIAIDKHQ